MFVLSHRLLLPLQRIMRISSISRDNLDFEANRPDDAAGPKGQRSGSPFSMVGIDEGDLASSIPESSPRNVGENKEPVVPSIALDSFLPLLRVLPALVQDQNAYHLRGAISKVDVQNLTAYAQTVVKFTLNGEPTGDEQYSIAPGAFMRLAQLNIHEAPGPLLPSLKQLRVVEPDELCISQLPLFFTKSLRTLEVAWVPEEQQSAFLSFLVTLVDEAPLLSTITLGPGSFTAACLNICLSFDHLGHLDLLDAASSIDFDFLVAVGRLPELGTFILNARTATYISPPSTEQDLRPVLDPEPPFALRGGPPELDECSNVVPRPPSPSRTDAIFSPEPSVGSPPQYLAQWSWSESLPPSPVPRPKLLDSPRPPEPMDLPSWSVSPDSAATTGRFSRLKRLDITGTLPLIKDLYEHVFSADLESLGLTLVRKAAPTFHKESEPITTSEIDLETGSFCTLVQTAVEVKWSLTLKGVRLGHVQDYRKSIRWHYETANPDPVPLPSATFMMLLQHEILEDLEITGWTLPSEPARNPPSDSILNAFLPNLKKIHLPVCRPTAGIQLDRLLSIIRAFPKLVSLQCGFEEPQTFPIPQIPAAHIPLHGLKVLSIGHEGSDIDREQTLRISRFLDILFPDLERIETHAGHHEEDWAYIHKLIQMCQASRLDHTTRLLSTAPQM